VDANPRLSFDVGVTLVFTEFIAHWEKQYKSVPSAKAIITEVAREWFQQTLTEVIYSVDNLRGDKQWSDQDVAAVLCPEALTAAVLPRYHLTYARFSELSSNHRTDLNVWGAPRRLSPVKSRLTRPA
jgi:hypothetical protein